ncbi:unnamed protein product [Amaranthus hypochondriacus]
MRGNSIYTNTNGIVALALLYVLLTIRVDARIDSLKISTQPRVTPPFDDDIRHPRQIPHRPSKTPPNQQIIYPPPTVDVLVMPPISPPRNPPLNAPSYSPLTATQTPVNPPIFPPSACYSYPTTSPPPNYDLPIITPTIAPTPSHSPSRAPIMMPPSPISTTPNYVPLTPPPTQPPTIQPKTAPSYSYPLRPATSPTNANARLPRMPMVEGYVYCNCQFQANNSPHPSATINISCRRNMFLKAQRIGITDKDGYFSTLLPQWATSGDCTAVLGDAPRKSLCSLKTDLNGGISAASITKSIRQPGFKIYTVGPFAYQSSGYC